MSDPSDDKPWMSSGPSMYRESAERLPMDLFSYTREAGSATRRFRDAVPCDRARVERAGEAGSRRGSFFFASSIVARKCESRWITVRMGIRKIPDDDKRDAI